MKSSFFYQEQYAELNRRLCVNTRKIAVWGDGFVADLIMRVLNEMGVCVSCYRRNPSTPDNMIPGVLYYQIQFDSTVESTYQNDVVVNAMANTNTSQTLTDIQINDQICTNVSLPIRLAQLSQSYNKHLVHISTACLHPDRRDNRFDVYSPMLQAEGPYYATKLLAETALRNYQTTTIVRPRLIYDSVDHPKNLLTRIAKYKSILDCNQTMTCRQTLVAAICHLIDHYTVTKQRSIVDVVDSGQISLADCTNAPHIDLVDRLPCDISSLTPTKVATTNILPLLQTGFTPISVHVGIKYCLSQLLTNHSVKD